MISGGWGQDWNCRWYKGYEKRLVVTCDIAFVTHIGVRHMFLSLVLSARISLIPFCGVSHYSYIFYDLSPGMNPIPFNRTHPIISINHLPIEILAHIFLLCILHGWPAAFCEYYDQHPQPNRDLAPLSVSQVCRHWREIALSVPSLWCSLAGPQGAVAALHPEFTQAWLARSRNLPLSLHLAPPFTSDPGNARTSKIFDIFSNEMHRWRTISLVLNENLAHQFIATADARAKNLEELESYFVGYATHLSADISSVLRFFSKLRKLSWRGRNVYSTSLENVPFHQLTHIHMSLIAPASDVIACLTKCTNAVEIYWNGVRGPDFSYVHGIPQIPLLQLQLLKLQGSGSLVRLLWKLTLPSLKFLHIQSSSATRDHRLLEDFFNRSSCPLQQFIFQDNLSLQSAVKFLTIPFLGSIPDIEVHSRSSVSLEVFQELKDSYTPTLDRLKFAYPHGEISPVFMWQ
ncbi:hypothetical protein K443DRAFT_575802 [Laccaria amethystina LaAM-08-1]|uniref:F-box domain-containing protein n=1 Tax=Laccaria amethystina LaAM-08-1 TaxID=1095629 RepID=A0A0C9XI71_9AGAR|nr:hypothetical protein K443DRAFT_575802 [Laccaria amethystina LaAM-08-1]